MNAIVTHMDTTPVFAERLEYIKQYQDGLVTFTELLLKLQMNATELDAVFLIQAAHSELAMTPNQVVQVLDDMMDKHNRGLRTVPKLVY